MNKPEHGEGYDTSIHPDRGLWLPPEFRNTDGQTVFRTPRATIQHYTALDDAAYYGMIDESHFGDPDDIRDPQNPELAPNEITIKLEGDDPTRLTVNTDTEIRADGGVEPIQHDGENLLLATNESNRELQIEQVNTHPTAPVFWFSTHTDLRRVGPAVATGSDIWVVRDTEADDIVSMALVDEMNHDQLHRLGVHPDYRRQGIATAVLDHLYTEYGTLELECREGLPANQFYEAIGMEHVTTEWGDPDDLLTWRLEQPPEHHQATDEEAADDN